MKKLIIGFALATFAASAAFAAPAQAPKSQLAICNGQVVGQDPDQNIVSALIRECGNQQAN
jgi:hypothetical protein